MSVDVSTDQQSQSAAIDGQQFWDLYLQEHQRPVNRWLHAVGTVTSWLIVGIAVFFQAWWVLLVAPLAGYGMAWVGHAVVEKNRPLSMKYPLRSFLADYRLTLLMMTGRSPHSSSSSDQSVQS